MSSAPRCGSSASGRSRRSMPSGSMPTWCRSRCGGRPGSWACCAAGYPRRTVVRARGLLCDIIVCEELGRIGATGPGFSLHSLIVAPYIVHHGTAALKRVVVPGLVSGERVAAIAMTEPGTGSDLAGIRTRGQRDGDGWVLSGPEDLHHQRTQRRRRRRGRHDRAGAAVRTACRCSR